MYFCSLDSFLKYMTLWFSHHNNKVLYNITHINNYLITVLVSLFSGFVTAILITPGRGGMTGGTSVSERDTIMSITGPRLVWGGGGGANHGGMLWICPTS